jgi:hypothetical protein
MKKGALLMSEFKLKSVIKHNDFAYISQLPRIKTHRLLVKVWWVDLLSIDSLFSDSLLGNSTACDQQGAETTQEVRVLPPKRSGRGYVTGLIWSFVPENTI